MRSRISSGLLSILIINFAFVVQAWGWGSVGHTAIGEIAQRHLDDNAKKAVKEILANETLPGVSIWPDQVRRTHEWAHSAGYHFTDVPEGSDFFETLRNMNKDQRAKGDSVLVLLKCEDILMDEKASAQEKQAALKFMVHVVGDLHQPLHAGHPDDLGGNKITFTWYGKDTNLHSVWDTNMIETYFKKDLAGKDLPAKGKALADVLDHVDQKTIDDWTSSYVDEWLGESLKFSKSAYASGYKTSQANYMKKNIVIIKQRLLQASYRLAYWLNAIFSGAYNLPGNALQLRRDLRDILGDQMDSIIDLNPKAVGAQLCPLNDQDDD